MTEKFKDLFYDCSDILLGTFIALIMILVISWKLLGTIAIPIDLSIKDNLSESNNITFNDTTNNIETSNENKLEQATDNNITSSTHENNNTEAIKLVPIEPEKITIKIPKGSTGYSIAKILVQKGLIDNSKEFINRVEELKLAPKLRFGTFTIKSDSSLDDIIYIITGTKK